MKNEAAEQVIRDAAAKWPTTFVPRIQVPKFTGGLIGRQTLANMDCNGQGPAGAFRIGRQVVYPLVSLTEWLISKVTKM